MTSRRGRAPMLCILDGSTGLRAAVERTWPQAAIQRCTVHTLRNLLTAAPTRLHDELRADYHAIVEAEDGAAARRVDTAFVRTGGKSCPGAVASLEEAGEELALPGCSLVAGGRRYSAGCLRFLPENAYLRPGMRFRDLQQPGEILVTGGVPQVGTVLGPRAHSIRFSAEQRIFYPSRLNLLPWYREAVVRLRAALALQPVESA